MGISIESVKSYNPGLYFDLKDLDSDKDGFIELPELKPPEIPIAELQTTQTESLQKNYRSILAHLGAKRPSGTISGQKVISALVHNLTLRTLINAGFVKPETYLSGTKQYPKQLVFTQQYRQTYKDISQAIQENFQSKKIGVVGDSTVYNMKGYTAFGGDPLTHFRGGDASLIGGIIHSLGLDPTRDINMQAFKETFPNNLNGYLTGKINGPLSDIRYALGMAAGMLLNGHVWQTNPGALVRVIAVPGATTTHAHTDFHNTKDPSNDHMGSFYGGRLVPKGKTMISMIQDHLRGSSGGAAFRILGPNDLFTWGGKILGGKSISPSQYQDNLKTFINSFPGQQRVIVSVPLDTSLLLSAITNPQAHYANESKIYPNGYSPATAAYAVGPLAWLANHGQTIHPRNVYNAQEMKELADLFESYRRITYQAASQSTKVVAVDPNDQLYAFFKEFQQAGQYEVGGCVFKSKEDFLSADMIHPGALLYTLIAKWISKDLRAAGINVPKTLDLEKMAQAHPEQFKQTFCPEKRTDKDMFRIGNYISAMSKTTKIGNPLNSLANLIGLERNAYIFFKFNTDENWGPGFNLSFGPRLLASFPLGPLQLSNTLLEVGAELAYLSSSGEKEGVSFDLHLRALKMSLGPASGVGPWTLSLAPSFHNLEEFLLSEQFSGDYSFAQQTGIDVTGTYCFNPKFLSSDNGLCVNAGAVVYPGNHSADFSVGIGYTGI